MSTVYHNMRGRKVIFVGKCFPRLVVAWISNGNTCLTVGQMSIYQICISFKTTFACDSEQIRKKKPRINTFNNILSKNYECKHSLNLNEHRYLYISKYN